MIKLKYSLESRQISTSRSNKLVLSVHLQGSDLSHYKDVKEKMVLTFSLLGDSKTSLPQLENQKHYMKSILTLATNGL